MLLRVSFLAGSNSFILVKSKKYIFRILQIFLTAGFVTYYYKLSFIHSFVTTKPKIKALQPWETNEILLIRTLISTLTEKWWVLEQVFLLQQQWSRQSSGPTTKAKLIAEHIPLVNKPEIPYVIPNADLI